MNKAAQTSRWPCIEKRVYRARHTTAKGLASRVDLARADQGSATEGAVGPSIPSAIVAQVASFTHRRSTTCVRGFAKLHSRTFQLCEPGGGTR